VRLEHRSGKSGIGGDDLTSGVTKGLLRLIEVLAHHAVDHGYDQCSAFQRQIREAGEKIEKATDGLAAVAFSTEAIDLVRTQNQQVDCFIRALTSEKQAVIHLFSESLIKVCTRSKATAQNLRLIEKELAKASEIGALRELKPKLVQALDAICLEAQVQERQLEELQPMLRELPLRVLPLDEVTGLPGMAAAEATIREFAKAGTTAYVVALMVTNLDVVNRKLNFAAGNKLLLLFSQEIAQRLTANDRLFRWRGPNFIAVLQRENSISSVKQEAAKFGSISQEKIIEDDRSSIFFKVSTAWRLFAIPKTGQLRGLSEEIDAFLFGEAPQDPPA